MKKAVLVSVHYLDSKRKAGFHWIAEALARKGWEVLFVTTSLSWLSVLQRDFRLSYPVRKEAGRIVPKGDRISSFVWFTPWHPANMRLPLLNRLTAPLFARYGRQSVEAMDVFVADSNLFLFESTAGLMLYERLRRLCPKARFVYRVSDDLRVLRCHPVVIEFERKAAPSFDLISVPSRSMCRLFDGCTNVKLQHHGMQKELFDADHPSPYGETRSLNAILVGTHHVDTDFLERASRLRPDIRFHIIGPIAGLPRRENVVAYGEMAWHRTVPFIRYADIGLQTLLYRPGAESFVDSLKVQQYTYCRLPIVAPAFLQSDRAHMISYDPGSDRSIEEALRKACGFERSRIRTDDIISWEDLVDSMVN